MTADIEPYLKYLDHCELSREEKLALLQDLWSIMESFVDEAWGLCPTQHFANDNDAASAGLDSINALKMLDSFHAANFNDPPRKAIRRRSNRKRRARTD